MIRSALFLSVVVALTACPDPAKDKPKAVVTAPTEVKKPDAPAPGTAQAFPFTQADSKVGFTGAKVTGKHEGGFNTFGGIIQIVANDVTKSTVSAEIDTNSVFTDSEKLTGHLKSPDFFDTTKFPSAKFVSTEIKKDGEGFNVTGNLTLHGVTKTISFPAKITAGAEQVDVLADFAINRKDFEIVYAGKADDLISDNVALKLDLHAKKQAAVPAPAQ